MSDKRNGRRAQRPVSGNPPRTQASGYGDAGASWTKRATKGFTATSGSPARDIDDNNYTLRQRSRMLYMSAPVATSAVRTMRTNVVGTGVIPRPRIDADALGMTRDEADAWGDAARREFMTWASDRRACDSQGLNDFFELQQLVMQSWLMSGDSIALVRRHKASALRPYTLRLQVVEADRVCTPWDMGAGGLRNGTTVLPYSVTTGLNPDTGNVIYDGVEVSGTGEIAAYWICNHHPFEAGNGPTEWARVSAVGTKSGTPLVLHVMESERPDQYRGVPYLAQAIEPLLQMRRYTSAELDAAVVQASFSAFVKTEDPTENPFNEVGNGVPGASGADESPDPNEYDLGPGTINYMLPGEDVTFADPSRPASGFGEFIEAMATQVGAALEIPKDLLLKQFNSSYSASRAALLEAWKAFRMRRRWLVSDFCRPVWELFVSEAVGNGRLSAPGFFTDPARRAAYLACEWIGPSQGQLDPTKEIQAELTAVSAGITTREAAAERINGSDWDSNVARLARENRALADAMATTPATAQADQPVTEQSATDQPTTDETEVADSATQPEED